MSDEPKKEEPTQEPSLDEDGQAILLRRREFVLASLAGLLVGADGCKNPFVNEAPPPPAVPQPVATPVVPPVPQACLNIATPMPPTISACLVAPIDAGTPTPTPCLSPPIPSPRPCLSRPNPCLGASLRTSPRPCLSETRVPVPPRPRTGSAPTVCLSDDPLKRTNEDEDEE